MPTKLTAEEFKTKLIRDVNDFVNDEHDPENGPRQHHYEDDWFGYFADWLNERDAKSE